MDPSNVAVRDALNRDRLIDIITTGAKTGPPRKTEAWFTTVNGRVIICGTPDAKGKRGPRSPRDWLANLKDDSGFRFCYAESLNVELPANAVLITDPEDRRK